MALGERHLLEADGPESKCSACGAAIIWSKHEKTGKPNPIDAEPSDDGNVLVVGERYTIVPAAERASHAGKLRKSHFVTCRDAASFRRGKS